MRTFRAPDARAGLAMVKAALGPEAVIISTREVTNGLFGKKEIEITAALAEPAPKPQVLPAQAYAPGRVATPVTSPPPPPRSDLSEALARAAEAAPPPGPREDMADELVRLRSALEEMRREVRMVSGQVRLERDLRLPPAGAELLGHLLTRGVEEALARPIIEEAVENADSTSGASVLAAARAALSERVVSGRAPWLADSRRRIIALVGPTGVGKTTTLAKIAARAIMESRLKVALITVDTYRIGASEQVLRYGEIMGLPTHVAKDRLELKRAVEQCARADLVLVDTAGRSVSEAVARQAELLRSVEGVQLFLTVSAATGPAEMSHAVERYRTLNPERLIVTKVDEAIGPGSLLSASVRIGRPVVAVTDGQRVPEDIHALSQADLVDLVLGEPGRAHHTSVTVGS